MNRSVTIKCNIYSIRVLKKIVKKNVKRLLALVPRRVAMSRPLPYIELNDLTSLLLRIVIKNATSPLGDVAKK